MPVSVTLIKGKSEKQKLSQTLQTNWPYPTIHCAISKVSLLQILSPVCSVKTSIGNLENYCTDVPRAYWEDDLLTLARGPKCTVEVVRSELNFL
jgi:hypothetical protein